MNAKYTTSDPQTGLPAWRGPLCCLAALVCLGGCGLNRCATWERVTHPDYMREEHTTLHGFHRTSWDPWPEEFGYSPWSRNKRDEVEAQPHSQERLPAAKPKPSLPEPRVEASKTESPDTSPPVRVFIDYSALTIEAPDESAFEELTDDEAIVFDFAQWTSVLATPTVELVANHEPAVVEPSPDDAALELDGARSSFTEHFASLIATHRKSDWQPLRDAPADSGTPVVRSTPGEIPATETSREAPAYLKLQEVELERIDDEPIEAFPGKAVKTQGDGAVQFRWATSNAGPILKVAGATPTSGDDTTPAAGTN